MSAGTTAVELRDVTKRYGGVEATVGVSLSIGEGEFFSLLGPSGCGKTTTLNLIGGFVDPDEGEILIQGRSVVGMPPYRRPVNTVFQNYALFPHMSVAENVSFGLRMRGVPASEIHHRVQEMLRLVSLTGLGSRRPSQLSGGQQQRVALARALVNRPGVLLLDEPLGSLDLKLRKQMQVELSRIQREVGITFVYVTHDQEEAMTMSDRIAIMNHGRVVQVGTPQAIYERPLTRFVADFVGASNTLDGVVAGADDGGLAVRLRSGVIVHVPAVAGVGVDRPVSIVVRPDRMDISTSRPAKGDNCLAGRVARLAFLGTHFQVVVATDGGGDVTVQHRSTANGAEAPLGVGDRVYVTWPVTQTLCFAD
ncbi:MAG: ABC transporter ATP-binding protein [Armatimonadota bacterium]|nr:ABC transporter ATP-binding protein [Armatimonadota bacterium]